MKEVNFEYSDGKQGSRFELEDGDEVISRFEKVGSDSNPRIVKGKAVIIENCYLGVLYNGQEITVKITGGQKKVLDKAGDLTGKTIKAHKYSNEYGEFVGVRVLKETEKTVVK